MAASETDKSGVEPTYQEKLLSGIKEAFRANLKPGLCLQAMAIALVFSYYTVPFVHDIFTSIGDLKVRSGYAFSIISTGAFGGVLPLVIVYARDKKLAPKFAVFATVFWLYKGWEVDAFYTFQGWMFGTATDFPTIAKKVAFDMFIYNPIWAVPIQTFLYRWAALDFMMPVSAAVEKMGGKQLLTLTMPCVMFTVWLVWLPTTSCVYALPSALQVPLFNIVLTFFVLVMTLLTGKKEAPAEGTEGDAAAAAAGEGKDVEMGEGVETEAMDQRLTAAPDGKAS